MLDVIKKTYHNSCSSLDLVSIIQLIFDLKFKNFYKNKFLMIVIKIVICNFANDFFKIML